MNHHNKKVLVFDTETTGLPSDYNKCPREHYECWPYIVQFSFVLFDLGSMKTGIQYDEIINTACEHDFEEASKIHGISKGMCKKRGTHIKCAVENFLTAAKYADIIVGHNLKFDMSVLFAELARNEMYKETQQLLNLHKEKEMYCTMMNSIKMCAIQGVSAATGRKYTKWPKLTELHQHLFDGIAPQDLHNSLNDVFITLRCFVAMYTSASVSGSGCASHGVSPMVKGQDIADHDRTARSMLRSMSALTVAKPPPSPTHIRFVYPEDEIHNKIASKEINKIFGSSSSSKKRLRSNTLVDGY